jgi:antitoxin component of MazEF toxin-antitoxin module
MKTQIKKWGDSKVIVLSSEFLKYMDLELGDWIDISDIIKLKKKQNGK